MNKDMQDAIVDHVRMILQQKNISQKDLASEISITEATLSNILHKHRAITTDEVDKIAKVLDVPVPMLYNPIPFGCKEAFPLLAQAKTKEVEETIQKLSILAQRTLFYKNLRETAEKQMEIIR
ncbi:plasmid maintenance system antidote protein [Sphaerochaeta pleomorpha str. Grapes]|uniref:Plasmid maintenance system antidote protein n=1 Tax=Sphaerochaeta pleomorpha (strain ATCC BAA-1885 / DSM 22778 / Grapes) TaxID=158190 RepID=G8QQR6_SPHPG|nr:helix-turn-helix transcriptional regulator [Sphaerochaeta pleomorpha]AEV28697.1 plasmid maintenance system antidote protein [Sphaerochaeta pleomorpha str. Grapes]